MTFFTLSILLAKSRQNIRKKCLGTRTDQLIPDICHPVNLNGYIRVEMQMIKSQAEDRSMAGKMFVTERTFISLYFQQWKPTFLYPQTPTTRVGRWERERQRHTERQTERGDRNRDSEGEAHTLRYRVKQLDRQWDTHREFTNWYAHTHEQWLDSYTPESRQRTPQWGGPHQQPSPPRVLCPAQGLPAGRWMTPKKCPSSQ